MRPNFIKAKVKTFNVSAAHCLPIFQLRFRRLFPVRELHIAFAGRFSIHTARETHIQHSEICLDEKLRFFSLKHEINLQKICALHSPMRNRASHGNAGMRPHPGAASLQS